MLQVPANDSSLSPGAIAGIVIAILIIVMQL